MSHTLSDGKPSPGSIPSNDNNSASSSLSQNEAQSLPSRHPNATNRTMTSISRFLAYVGLAGLCIVVLTAYDVQSDFERAPNGTTLLCEDADVGDTGEIDGIVYTKRTADQITPDNAATTCTSGITDMSELFRVESMTEVSFNENISTWDVSSVENMRRMFLGARSFNQDIGDWDVSNVNYFRGMFDGARSFNPEYAPEGAPLP